MNFRRSYAKIIVVYWGIFIGKIEFSIDGLLISVKWQKIFTSYTYLQHMGKCMWVSG